MTSDGASHVGCPRPAPTSARASTALGLALDLARRRGRGRRSTRSDGVRRARSPARARRAAPRRDPPRRARPATRPWPSSATSAPRLALRCTTRSRTAAGSAPRRPRSWPGWSPRPAHWRATGADRLDDGLARSRRRGSRAIPTTSPPPARAASTLAWRRRTAAVARGPARPRRCAARGRAGAGRRAGRPRRPAGCCRRRCRTPTRRSGAGRAALLVHALTADPALLLAGDRGPAAPALPRAGDAGRRSRWCAGCAPPGWLRSSPVPGPASWSWAGGSSPRLRWPLPSRGRRTAAGLCGPSTSIGPALRSVGGEANTLEQTN